MSVSMMRITKTIRRNRPWSVGTLVHGKPTEYQRTNEIHRKPAAGIYETALQKYAMISLLLDENLDPAAARELRRRLAEQHGVSERTLRRYVSAYNDRGFEGLKPAERVQYCKDVMPDNYEELLAVAIRLRRKVLYK